MATDEGFLQTFAGVAWGSAFPLNFVEWEVVGLTVLGGGPDWYENINVLCDGDPSALIAAGDLFRAFDGATELWSDPIVLVAAGGWTCSTPPQGSYPPPLRFLTRPTRCDVLTGAGAVLGTELSDPPFALSEFHFDGPTGVQDRYTFTRV